MLAGWKFPKLDVDDGRSTRQWGLPVSYQWNEHLDESIGEEIQHLRISAGLSQAALGAAVGVSYQQLQRYETGQSPLTVERLARISAALKVEPGHFFGQSYRPRSTASDLGPLDPTIGLLSREDLELAAKIARIRDDAARRDIIASIERLANAMQLSQNQRSSDQGA